MRPDTIRESHKESKVDLACKRTNNHTNMQAQPWTMCCFHLFLSFKINFHSPLCSSVKNWQQRLAERESLRCERGAWTSDILFIPPLSLLPPPSLCPLDIRQRRAVCHRSLRIDGGYSVIITAPYPGPPFFIIPRTTADLRCRRRHSPRLGPKHTSAATSTRVCSPCSHCHSCIQTALLPLSTLGKRNSESLPTAPQTEACSSSLGDGPALRPVPSSCAHRQALIITRRYHPFRRQSLAAMLDVRPCHLPPHSYRTCSLSISTSRDDLAKLQH